MDRLRTDEDMPTSPKFTVCNKFGKQSDNEGYRRWQLYSISQRTLRRVINRIKMMYCFIACVLVAVVPMAHGAPLLKYEFSAKDCSTGSFPNLGTLGEVSIYRNKSTTDCSLGNLGIESKEYYLHSPKNHVDGPVEPLLEAVQALEPASAGISISLWIRLLEQDSIQSPIFTIGDAATDTVDGGITECDRKNVDLQFSRHQNHFKLLFRTSDPFFEPCQQLEIADSSIDSLENGLLHVAVVLTDGHQQFFINGEPSVILEDPFDATLRHWNKASKLNFFSYRNDPIWYGRIYGFEVHAARWDRHDVRSIMSLGAGPSEPYSLPSRFRINEDAEIEPGSHTQRWYQSPHTFADSVNAPFDFPVFSITIFSLEEEVHALLDSLRIDHNWFPHPVSLHISRFPKRGTLFQRDGTNLSAVAEQSRDSLVLLDAAELIFVPEHNEYSSLPGSSYADIQLCLAITEIFSLSQCASFARIDFVVDPVNDPPVARLINIQQPYKVHEGVEEEDIPLTLYGTDIDFEDHITAVEISVPPQLGFLYLSVLAPRTDGLYHGTPLADMAFRSAGHRLDVEYRYTATDRIVRQSVVVDTFEFRVQDTHETWSEPVRATIQVLPNLANSIDESVTTVKEDEEVTVLLGGEDMSGLNRSIGFFIESLPDGDLQEMKGENLSGLEPGDILNDPESGVSQYRTGLQFSPPNDTCQDTKIATTAFDFHIVALEADSQVASVANRTTQNIEIECKLPKMELYTPQETTTIHAFNDFMDIPCSGYMFNASTEDAQQCRSAAVFRNIVVKSSITHDREATVGISCNHGFLTLNRNRQSLFRQLENQTVMRRSIGFLALPKDLTSILDYLHYQSSVEGPDEIRITIMYGNCDQVNETVSDSFYESQCFAIERSLKVQVLPAIPIPKKTVDMPFPWPLPMTFAIVLTIKLKGKLREIIAIKSEGEVDDGATVEETAIIRWRQFYDEETGFFYYQNLEDGSVTWQPPLDEDFIPAEDDGDEDEEESHNSNGGSHASVDSSTTQESEPTKKDMGVE